MSDPDVPRDVPEPIRPQDDIGPIYKALGFIVLFGILLIIGIQALRGEHVGLHDVLFTLLGVILCLALIRPDKFDIVIKNIADRLPMFKYTKEP